MRYVKRPGGGREVVLGLLTDKLEYVTWDAEFMNMNIAMQTQLEHQLGAMIGTPTALINAQGTIPSGSAMKRLYVMPYTITKRAQMALLPKLQQVVRLAGSPVTVMKSLLNGRTYLMLLMILLQ